ncbi:SDR family NAD(P)-dependent oxidoreductase [Pseudorhodoferax sp. LjRoot39]|uniref:SDR family NAD(P)-dependent oxidoreductase n=1 Tax=Pseudorhodoferax sp. LjRoot39 TaxID=3342328 RepID=UPI003ECDE81E
MTADARPPALPLDLTGRVVFVAGGGSAGPGWSIGRAACVTYARLGARVCVADRDADSAAETTALVRAEGGEAETLVGDVAVEADVVRLFAAARERFGPIDALHHNVGIGKTGGPMETSAEDFDRIHAVNVRSLLLCAQQVLPAMAERGRGALVAISSVAGMRYVGYPHLGYSVTKAAVTQFTRMVAQQYAGQGIRANTVVPGLIDTPRIAGTVAKMFSDSSLDEARAARARQVPMQRMGTAWDVAHACAFLLSDAAAYVTGTELVVDGGLTGKYS